MTLTTGAILLRITEADLSAASWRPSSSTASPDLLHVPEFPSRLCEAFGEDVTDYVMAIKVYDLTYRRHRNRDGDCDCIVSASLRMGTYDVNWNFHWGRAALGMSPE